MDKRKLSEGANLLRLSSLGITFVLCTFAGLGLGLLLRRFFHCPNWVVIVCLLFGIITSYVILFEDLMALQKEDQKPPKP